MITGYGKLLRKLRIDKGEILKDMADKLDMSSSYLSSIECGKRKIQPGMTDKIIDIYSLSSGESDDLRKAELMNADVLEVPLENMTSTKQNMAVIFARTFKDIDDETAEKIKNLLKKED